MLGPPIHAEKCTHRSTGDVRQIGRDTGSVDDIVESKLIDEGAGLEKERERLQDSEDGVRSGTSLIL